MEKVLGIVAVALSALALGVSLTRGSGSAPEAPPPPPVADKSARAEPGGQDDGRLNSLEFELSRLMKRVDTLERAGVARPGDPAVALSPDQQAKQLQALRSDVDSLLTGEPLGTEEGRKRLKEVVRAVQDEMFADRTQQREAQQEQERTDRLKKFIEAARLTATQAQDLTKLMDDEAAQRKALWDARRQAGAAGPQPGMGTGQQVREQMRSLRQTTDNGVKALLSAEQFTQYEAMRSEERGSGRGPGGGGNRR
ncbi:MAG: hypothetical protein QM765_23820 [Myxococcales bacterium]